MYVASKESDSFATDISSCLPREIRHCMYGINLDGATEIRMRLGKPICIHYNDGLFYPSKNARLTKLSSSGIKATREMIDKAIEIATNSSVYSVCEQIKNGYITVPGGHRIGITGTAVVKNDKITFIKDVSGLNYRLAHEVIGAADKVMPFIEDKQGIKNTLIISSPGVGKTTMLRDIVRQLSYKSYRVSVVDERSEIASLCNGYSAFDLGFSTDVLDGTDKAEGMLMMLRAMTPDVIVTDEIGSKADIEAIEKITNSGAGVIASIHGKNLEMIRRREDLKCLLKLFDVFVTLGKSKGLGTVEEVNLGC